MVVLSKISPKGLAATLAQGTKCKNRIIRKYGGVIVAAIAGNYQVFWRGRRLEKAYSAGSGIFKNCSNKTTGHKIALAYGKMAGDFFGPKQQYQIVGHAVSLTEAVIASCEEPGVFTDEATAGSVGRNFSFVHSIEFGNEHVNVVRFVD
jgi:hypothetical protein